MSERKYFIDWLRVIAIWILIMYHIVGMFQEIASRFYFIQSPQLLKVLLVPISIFNVFRIPLLFFVSGMGIYFSLQRRTWKQLLGERIKRILIPFIFGFFFIVPIQFFFYQKYYLQELNYTPGWGHLWFLANIFSYVLIFIPLLYYFKHHPDNGFIVFFRNLIGRYPVAIYLLVLPYILHALTIPSSLFYWMFFDPRVGALLGAFAFLLGFIFISFGEVVWKSISKLKYYALAIAFILFFVRLFVFGLEGPHLLTAIESINWIIASFGFGYTFLNKKSKPLTYLNGASYPVYIVHMAFQFLGAYIIFPLNLTPWFNLVFLIVFTFAGCYLTYEIIRRISFLRPLFGMKVMKK